MIYDPNSLKWRSWSSLIERFIFLVLRPSHPGIWTTITMAAKYIGAILEIHLDAAIEESFNSI
jgi:hypothetical protein